jgi:nicotinamidase-related amidase
MRKILVVIDMQNDFIDGALGTKEAEAIVDKVVQKIYYTAKEDVYGTMDTHDENYLNTQEGQKLPVPHCIFGTKGWELHPKVKELIDPMQFFTKDTFASSHLGIVLTELSRKEKIEIELIGLCTDICVVSNALFFKGLMPNVPITVDSSCCAGVTPETHKAALETMKMCQITIK